MTRDWDEQTLGQEVAARRFAMIELSLYLDTHPESDDARAAFDDARGRYESAKDTYARTYGPLSLCDVEAAAAWTWGARPMPEEGD